MREQAFPKDDYTPNGYIDNPFHTRNMHPSGVLRTSHRVGIGWWYPTNRISDADVMGTQYVSNLELAFRVGDKTLATRSDYERLGVALRSGYHSRNVMSFDFDLESISVSAAFYLTRENALTCRIDVANTGSGPERLTICATNFLQIMKRGWWGADGLAGYYVRAQDAIVQTIWAYGHQFALGSDTKSAAYTFAGDEDEWVSQVSGAETRQEMSTHGREPSYGTLVFELELAPGSSESFTVCLARGMNSKAALAELGEGLRSAASAFDERLAEDDAFWGGFSMLTGDWPGHWKRGWVYDIETQRMNSRPPIGIYKHRWDAMLVNEPRAVLGETAIDAMTLSYGDMPVALEELFGVFADAPYPNVPCSREDGTMNMIAADGGECGTAPSWCFPFHIIHSVYCRTRDREWLAKLYPYMCEFIDWWFENRTDADGWFHCKCSWESGQDGSKRFLVEGDPGAVSEYVRTVDVESGVAQALAHLAGYAAELGKEDDARKWRELARFRTENVREMFIDGWYRDIDARTGKPIILEDYLDIMMISPVICGVATPEQVAALEPKFIHFKENPHPWLQWPSFMLPYSESGCYAGHRDLVADAIYEVADRTYRRLDARRPWMRQDVTDRPAYRVPGVAYEFWPTDGEVPGGSENYGWGATMPIFIIRSLFGFREDQDFTKRAFEIAPTMPAELLKEGRTYGVTNLTYRGVKFDLNCEVGPSGRLDVTLSYESEEPAKLRVVGTDGQESASTASGASGKIELSGANGAVYRVEVE